MKAKQIRELTGCRTKFEGIAALVKQLEARSWHRSGREYAVSGYDHRKDKVHFFSCWDAGEKSVGISRLGLSMADALSEMSGDLKMAERLL